MKGPPLIAMLTGSKKEGGLTRQLTSAYDINIATF
jgi:hypothetical protein